MLKLIVSDIDGTLIPYVMTELPPDLFDIINQLHDVGITFCPASGRQYHSMRTLFAPVSDNICYICENGGIVYGIGTENSTSVLSMSQINFKDAAKLSQMIMSIPYCDVMISSKNTSYLFTYGNCSAVLERELVEWGGNIVKQIKAFDDIHDPVVKIGAYCTKDIDNAMDILYRKYGAVFRGYPKIDIYGREVL